MNKFPVRTYSKTKAPLVIAHRGASGYHPENTMAAFSRAVALGADMIECDIQLSKDGIPMVIHDEELSRTTNGKGFVRDFTAKELQKLDAGSWFSQKNAGERIPTLQEVLHFVKGKVSINIEIKAESVSVHPENGIAQKAIALVKEFEMESHVLFSSFNYRAISHIQNMDKRLFTALLYERKQAKGQQISELMARYGAGVFNCSMRQFTKKRAQRLLKAEIPVLVYTVNKPTAMQKMLKRGAVGIFTDYPDRLRNVVDNLWKTK